jgi:hypothetical protein
MSDDLPTPRSTLRANYRVLVWCKACWHRAEVDLQRLIDDGHGDVPLIQPHYQCSTCAGGSWFTDWVVTSGYMPQPWRVEKTPPERQE